MMMLFLITKFMKHNFLRVNSICTSNIETTRSSSFSKSAVPHGAAAQVIDLLKGSSAREEEQTQVQACCCMQQAFCSSS